MGAAPRAEAADRSGGRAVDGARDGGRRRALPKPDGGPRWRRAQRRADGCSRRRRSGAREPAKVITVEKPVVLKPAPSGDVEDQRAGAPIRRWRWPRRGACSARRTRRWCAERYAEAEELYNRVRCDRARARRGADRAGRGRVPARAVSRGGAAGRARGRGVGRRGGEDGARQQLLQARQVRRRDRAVSRGACRPTRGIARRAPTWRRRRSARAAERAARRLLREREVGDAALGVGAVAVGDVERAAGAGALRAQAQDERGRPLRPSRRRRADPPRTGRR